MIDAGSGQEISLNLRQSDIRGYTREGANLEIVLADGRLIILQGYFGEDGSAQSRLFISADGYLNEVTMIEGADGTVFAQYGPTELWGKWSPSEDLIFLDGSDVAVAAGGEENVSMLGAGLLGGSGLLGALGIGGAGLVTAGVLTDDGGGGGGAFPPIAPVTEPAVDDTPIVIGGDDVDPETEGFGINGVAEPGSEVCVDINGIQVITTAGEDGTWEAIFTGDTFPEDGEYNATVLIKAPDGTETPLDGPQVIIDTTPPETAFGETTVTTDDLVNLEEYNDGVAVSGTGEVGATIVTTIEGISHETVVGGDGTWSVIYAPGELPTGEYDTTVTVISSDSYGNTTTISEDFRVDTLPHPIAINADTVEGDGVVNFVEASDGVTITGTSTAGVTVTVVIEGLSQQVVVAADGSWSATFDGLPGGEYDATITASTVDVAGNASSTTETIRIDTEVRNFSMTGETGGADGVINAAEHPAGFTITGTTEPGSTVVLEMNGQSVNATVAADGSWSATFTGAMVQQGTYSATLTATTVDAAGNVETLSQVVDVDTDAGALTLNAAAIGGDGTVNFDEAAAGVAVTGTADPGATVIVTLDGVSHTTLADSNGNWTTTYTNAEITPGTHTPDVSAYTEDAAGNSRSVEATVHVDTEVLNLGLDGHALATNSSDGSDVINSTVAGNGFDITGTVEVGSTVSVTLDGVTHTAVIDGSGNWTASFGAGEIAGGERMADLVVNVTDPAGNTAQLTDTVEVDTFVNTLTQTGAIEGDNVINAAEAADGVQVGGQVEPGSSVTLSAFGQSFAATVDASGNWSVNIPGSAIGAMEGPVDMIITATDDAGNTSAITETVSVDTVTPEDPDIVGYFREGGGYRSVTTETSADDVTIHQIDGSGSVNELSVQASEDAFLGETDYHFLNAAGAPTTIPDGSELIVTNTDDAGNASSTYVVLDETTTTTVDAGSAALDGFNIETIDLRFGDNSNLTITEAQIRELSENSDQVVVRGGADDTVTITGATASGQTTIDGETFNVYTLGADATIVVDDQINVVI
ncbi:Ig-like domain-containing protein [Roseovarius faecimaris]|uniref:Ig-like domain-containing protein n=1 Tax=Roseovarius faecimaris TaxID=2494550 RepID=UPI001FE8F837|nr:Ig-like domain-containing protein [Roseovarius faecimaris]